MTRGLNKVLLIGRLGQDPEMRYTPSGKPLTKFQLAVNRSWTTDGEKKTETEWFNIVAWGKLAEICNQYLKKGQQVYIDGRLHTRYWQDDEGANHSTVEVITQEMIMLGNRSDNTDADADRDIPDEDYPF
ncbi:MAG: single-stranded DNA-binding protein [Anaerolineales bacterium]|jgi:single-strand DNA-binding protein